MRFSRLASAALAGLFAIGIVHKATAQTYPAKPIALIVPFAAGGPSDVIARLVGDHMSRTLVIAGKLALPPTDAKAFFAYAKQNADKLTIVHAGIGSNAHLCATLLSQALGVKFTQVAYRGTGPAMNDLISGQIDVICDQTTTAIPQIQANQVRAYAVTSPVRLTALSDTPTMKEAGTDLEMAIWHGLYAPKLTPGPILEKLNSAVQVALKDPKVIERFNLVGTIAFPDTEWSRQAHAKRFNAEIDKWATVLKAAGLTPQSEK